MAFSLPNGTTYQVATAYAASIAVTAATNAAEAVLTTAANTYAVGDLVEFTSGWTRANLRVFRVKTASSTSVTLEGFDTTSTTLFPAGAGIGSLRKPTTLVAITQVISCDPSGGDAKFVNVEPMDTDTELSIPAGYSARTLAMVIGDDPTLPQHAALQGISDGRKIALIKAQLPTGSVVLYNGYITYDPSPKMTKGQVITVAANMAQQSQPVRYAS
jgi:hypothetical protein